MNNVQHHSADVRLELMCNGVSHDLAAVCDKFVTMRTPVDLPVMNAEVVVTVDGDRFTWPIRMPKGAVKSRGDIEIQIRGDMVKGLPQACV